MQQGTMCGGLVVHVGLFVTVDSRGIFEKFANPCLPPAATLVSYRVPGHHATWGGLQFRAARNAIESRFRPLMTSWLR